MTYVNGILTAVVRLAFPSPSPVHGNVYTEQQAVGVLTDWVVVAQLPGGGSRVDPRFPVARSTVQVDGYAKGSSKRAQANCQTAIDAIVAACRAQTDTPDGRIARLLDVEDPSPLDHPAPDVYRYVATLQITVR